MVVQEAYKRWGGQIKGNYMVRRLRRTPGPLDLPFLLCFRVNDQVFNQPDMVYSGPTVSIAGRTGLFILCYENFQFNDVLEKNK